MDNQPNGYQTPNGYQQQPNQPGGYQQPNQPNGFQQQPSGYPQQYPNGYPQQPNGYPQQQPNGYPQQGPMVVPSSVDNVAMGTLGAFLGSLVGVACIVILGRIGIISALSGVVMALCALIGYEKLGGALTIRGIVISIAFILIMTFVGDYIDWGFVVSEQLGYGLFEALGDIPRLLERGIIDTGNYMGNLVRLYLFAAIGAVPTILSFMRK